METNKANEAIELSAQELHDVAGGKTILGTPQDTYEEPDDVLKEGYQKLNDAKDALAEENVSLLSHLYGS